MVTKFKQLLSIYFQKLPPKKISVSILVGSCIFLITLWLWQRLEINEIKQIQRKTQLAALEIQQNIETNIENRVLALLRIAKQWEISGRPLQPHWEAHATLYLKHYPGLQAIEWVDSNYQIQWIVPLADNEVAQNFNLSLEEKRRQAGEAARNRREITLTATVNLLQGGKDFIVYIPIFLEGKIPKTLSNPLTTDQFDGFILGVFDLENLLNKILNQRTLVD